MGLVELIRSQDNAGKGSASFSSESSEEKGNQATRQPGIVQGKGLYVLVPGCREYGTHGRHA